MAIRIISILSWLAMGIIPLPAAFSQPSSCSFEQLDRLQKEEPRNVIVFIHTDWCRFCLEMENTTFADQQVKTLLNNDFWFISLDAEEKRTITFGGSEFNYRPRGIGVGTHELAEQLGTINGKLSFPSICILNPENEIIFRAGQFLTAKDLTKILKILTEND